MPSRNATNCHTLKKRGLLIVCVRRGVPARTLRRGASDTSMRSRCAGIPLRGQDSKARLSLVSIWKFWPLANLRGRTVEGYLVRVFNGAEKGEDRLGGRREKCMREP